MKTSHLTLCFIAYREAATIERFLTAWRPYYDAISFVQAVGESEPDGTEQAVIDFCDANRVPLDKAEYRNAPGHKWAHVDDFAAARQLAFDRGHSDIPGDWLFWADVDDLPDGDPEAFRALAESDAIDLWRFPYEVPDAGKMIMRERLVRATAWPRCKWVGAVHEVIAKHDDVRMADAVPDAVANVLRWIHRPTEAKEKDPTRNLRILNSQLESAPTNLFYVAQEYMAAGNIPLMQRYARLFIAMPAADKAMQYQARLWLCKAADTKAEASEHALAALWLYPYAEALAACVKCAMQEDDAPKAAYFAAMLEACKVPAELIWCHEPRWYGWAREDLLRRVKRMNGQQVEPYERQAYIRASDPGQAVQTREIWLATAEDKRIEIGFVCENDKCRHWLRQFHCWPTIPDAALHLAPDAKPISGWDEASF
jgi:hypothetical protein